MSDVLNKKKQIVMILTNEFLPDVRVYKEAKYLISKGFDITILCWQRDLQYDFPLEEDVDGMHVVRYRIPSIAGSGYRQLFSFAKFIRKCRLYLETHPCDYLHCNDIDGAIVGYMIKKAQVPMIFDMHEFYEKGNMIRKKLWRGLTIFLLKKSIAGLYENSAYLKPEYKAVRNKLYPLRNYPDRSLIEVMPKVRNGSFKVGYHGAVRRQVPFFAALFEAVKDMGDVRVDINGEGPDNPELIEIAKAYSNVFIHGPFDGTKVLGELYANTDVLFCGYDKNIPNYQGDAEVVKFYEAIFTGTPMIMTDGIGMAEKVRNGGFGLICDVSKPTEIKAAILKLKQDRVFWEECSANEKKNAKLYDWDEAVKVLSKIYG